MDKKSENNKFNHIIETAMKNLNGLIDVNTVVGKPIKTENNDYIIPVSKVTFGILCGGGEYGKIGIFKKGSDMPYSAGNGALVSVKPCGFLIKNGNSDYKLMSVANNSYEKIFEKTADILNNNFSVKGNLNEE